MKIVHQHKMMAFFSLIGTDEIRRGSSVSLEIMVDKSWPTQHELASFLKPPLEIFFPGCRISIVPFVFPQLAFRRLAVVQNSTQKCDLLSGSIQLQATQNVSRTCPAHRSFFLISHSQSQSSKHRFVPGLWFLAFTSTLHFPPPD